MGDSTIATASLPPPLNLLALLVMADCATPLMAAWADRLIRLMRRRRTVAFETFGFVRPFLHAVARANRIPFKHLSIAAGGSDC